MPKVQNVIDRASDALLWPLARKYSQAYAWIKNRYSRDLRGLGFTLRRLKQNRIFEACGLRWQFDTRISTTYMRLLGGSYNEPDTHVFVQFVLAAVEKPLVFIDVGANIGEFVMAAAAHRNVSRVIGFEPHPVCAAVCRANIQLNGFKHVVLREVPVGDGTPVPYVADTEYSHASGVRWGDSRIHPLPTVRLDDELRSVTGPAVVLMDVEGAELDVMRGGRDFIRTQKPLLIFEYNYLTREFFTLAEVRAELGDEYELFRLRGDGCLDRELDATWNCVAVHTNSVFADICSRRLNPVPLPRWNASLRPKRLHWQPEPQARS